MPYEARRITQQERRARLVRRHHLKARAADVTRVAGDLVGFHSTDPASVFLAARARVRGFVAADLERALYDERALVRVLGMRRTMFVVPVELAPVVHGACTRALARRERKRTIAFVEGGGVAPDGARWLAKVEKETLALLEARGEATAVELGRELPELRKKIPVGVGTRWEGEIGVSTRVLFLLANDAKIVRARPRGSWLSTQYRWAPARAWLGRELDTMPEGVARTELARRWLASYGPGTIADLKWWTGWTVAQARAALDAVDAVAVRLDDADGYVLPGDEEPVHSPEASAALLPALDPTVMGWTGRDWYLGDHRSALFDRNGNAGPTVWWGGRIIGGWAQRPEGDVVVRLLEDAGAEARRAVDDEAGMLGEWLGEVRVIPRFRTPLEKELTA